MIHEIKVMVIVMPNVMVTQDHSYNSMPTGGGSRNLYKMERQHTILQNCQKKPCKIVNMRSRRGEGTLIPPMPCHEHCQ